LLEGWVGGWLCGVCVWSGKGPIGSVSGQVSVCVGGWGGGAGRVSPWSQVSSRLLAGVWGVCVCVCVWPLLCLVGGWGPSQLASPPVAVWLCVWFLPRLANTPQKAHDDQPSAAPLGTKKGPARPPIDPTRSALSLDRCRVCFHRLKMAWCDLVPSPLIPSEPSHSQIQQSTKGCGGQTTKEEKRPHTHTHRHTKPTPRVVPSRRN
jgi:hypothetical protein